MQLISLTANQSSFKPVYFKNETGLNFIVAIQKNPNSSVKGKTFNGVGKSLLVSLVHFCLGSSKKDAFKKKLPGWIFTLKFKVGEKEYNSERAADNQSKINLNGDLISVTDFNRKFGAMIFDVPQGMGQLSFRSLIPFFIRPRRASYTDFNNPNSLNSNYQIQITNAFLLGLDVLLIDEKLRLRKEKERIKSLVKELSNDKLLKDFFLGRKDISLAKQELEEKISELEQDLESFEVAENYYEIKNQADQLKGKIEKKQNQIVLAQNQIQNIEESRKISPDIKKENILRIYNEASVIVKEEALKQLSELEDFYQHLSVNREKRLLDQKNNIQRELEQLQEETENLQQEFDSKLKYLDAHKALDVFLKLSTRLSDMRTELGNISRYEDLLKKYQESKLDIEESFIEATKKTNSYLYDAKDIIKRTAEFFRELAKRFYPNSPAGITIYNNDGDNQIRFNIDAKIEADASDGINNVKIFCYDMTILLKGFAHKVNFLFHDSRLIDGIDPRQTAELFKTVNEYILQSNKQYILTLNQNQLDEVKKYLSKEEFSDIVIDNICLELKDDSAEDKLLGIQVDMEYE